MRFLPGVDPEYLHPALLSALYMGDECFKAVGSELIVTHLGDGKHGVDSLHYKGRAGDCRTKHLDKGLCAQVETAWRAKLGAPGELYDLVWEAKGGDNEHFHIELDIKARKPTPPFTPAQPKDKVVVVRPTK